MPGVIRIPKRDVAQRRFDRKRQEESTMYGKISRKRKDQSTRNIMAHNRGVNYTY